ncbi:ran-binding protein 3a isoform X2 [Electrophorus electricus]|uniref:ran-binding protein 3a isoform X2 n=1 Tax=Electrophorus electricus TaxID=8005 RepID=UPI0015D0A725|nr:ran-binding protein 3a isoform X2 [Electrophorus electricus]
MADSSNEDEPALAAPVFLLQKDRGQKRSADGSSAEDGDDSDRDDGSYYPPAKRETLSSFTQFPPSHSVSRNNVFMPSSFCPSPSGNSDSEPEEKVVGFRLRPPTLIHGQAPSTGVPAQKPKEQQRSVLRPPLLQAPPTKPLGSSNVNSNRNGANKPSEAQAAADRSSDGGTHPNDRLLITKNKGNDLQKNGQVKERALPHKTSFVFGQKIEDRIKVDDASEYGDSRQATSQKSEATNYFLQYINATSLQKVEDCSGEKFVFGQNMCDRVLSPLKCCKPTTEGSVESKSDSGPASEPCSSQDVNSEQDANAAESLEESAAAYTKATAKECLLGRVEVQTGEESESNVLQIQCKLFVFDKSSQSWVERGCGLLRLNDMLSNDVHNGNLQSRLVMRTQGSLRLILNTKLWAQMQVDKASEKSIRLTAMDAEDQGVKVFLISASSKDSSQLFAALYHRMLALRSHCEQPAGPQTALPEAEGEAGRSSDEDESRTAGPAPATGIREGGEFQPPEST